LQTFLVEVGDLVMAVANVQRFGDSDDYVLRSLAAHVGYLLAAVAALEPWLDRECISISRQGRFQPAGFVFAA
jgi:hypothetical protein